MTENQTQPQKTFDELYSNKIILGNLKGAMGFTSPTPIQVGAAPFILEGKDLFAGAKTGSGKTIGFLAPLAERIFQGQTKAALVLCPTRELALQSDEEAMKLLDGQTEVVSLPLYGGVPVDPQVLALRHHRPKILIATPGRVIDLVQEGVLPIQEIEAVVLDEADRMCDMGFAPQVSQILDLCVARKQLLFFSATLPKELNEIMTRFANSPERIQVDAADRSSETIQHRAILCSRRDKMNKLLELVGSPETVSLIFTRTRNQADEVFKDLKEYVQNIGILHAGFEMDEREKTIRDYREGRIKHLVATDVVSRGIDIDTITHVIHFELPDQLEDYIHRSGRVGRAGRQGVSIAIIDERNFDSVQMLKNLMKKIPFSIIGNMPEEREGERSPRRDGRSRQDGRRPQRESRGPREKRREEFGRGPTSREPRHSQRPSPSRDRHTRRAEPRTAKQNFAKPSGIVAKTKAFFSKIFKG